MFTFHGFDLYGLPYYLDPMSSTKISYDVSKKIMYIGSNTGVIHYYLCGIDLKDKTEKFEFEQKSGSYWLNNQFIQPDAIMIVV